VTDILIKQLPIFKRIYKKLHNQEKLIVNTAIRDIVKNPLLGQEKKGDLSKVFVYKFKVHHQEMLLAYEWNTKEIILLALGTHENFYRDLKRNK
jgi:mRNA interferase RelE/StbE